MEMIPNRHAWIAGRYGAYRKIEQRNSPVLKPNDLYQRIGASIADTIEAKIASRAKT